MAVAPSSQRRLMTPDQIAELLPRLTPSERAEMMRLTAQLERSAAQDNLALFATSVDIPTVPPDEDDEASPIPSLRLAKLAAHHRLICDAIQRTVDGLDMKDGRPVNLMLLMPPGSAKSTYADVVAVPWFMARKARGRGGVILASYASDIAKKQGRRARQLIRSPSFARVFPKVGLAPDQSAADEWALTNGNEYMAGGLLSGLTGNRAALGILDDPIKGREAAESPTIRDKTWDAYIDDFCSRLIPGAPQIMILTRWHQDDPAGRILPEGWAGESGLFNGRDGRLWRVICLPALAEHATDPLGREIGETLWPEWFSLEHWEPFQKNPRTWASLYQQRPSPAEGTFFQEAWFKRYSVRPKNLNYYLTSDHAPKGSLNGDYNVYNIWGIDPNNHLWLVEEFRAQCKMDKALGVVLDEVTGEATLADVGALPMIKRWKPFAWFPEDDATWKANEPFIRSMMRRLKIACRVEALTAAGDKPTKAQPFQTKALLGEVHLPEGLVGDGVLDEYKAFPAGAHDDRVDAAANIARALDMAHAAIVPVVEKVEGPQDRYARMFARQNEDDGKFG
jgi:hypothetical protein